MPRLCIVDYLCAMLARVVDTIFITCFSGNVGNESFVTLSCELRVLNAERCGRYRGNSQLLWSDSLCEQRAYLNIAYISYSLIIYIKSLFHYCTFLYKKSTPKVFVYETLTVLETSICGDLIEVFDIFKGFEDVDGSCFFSKSGTELRGHSYELLKERSRLYVRKRKWVELR